MKETIGFIKEKIYTHSDASRLELIQLLQGDYLDMILNADDVQYAHTQSRNDEGLETFISIRLFDTKMPDDAELDKFYKQDNDNDNSTLLDDTDGTDASRTPNI